MKLTGDQSLVESFIRVVRLCEIGEYALQQFPKETLEIEMIAGIGGTAFDLRSKAIEINFDKEAKRTPGQQCAVLCHEMFHFFHSIVDIKGYNDRKFRPFGSYKWTSYEEELTITGSAPLAANVDFKKWNHKLFNENAVLKELGLSPRLSHGGFEECSENKNASANVLMDFTALFKN